MVLPGSGSRLSVGPGQYVMQGKILGRRILISET